MYKIRAGVKCDFGKIIILLIVTIISLSSLCKNREENYLEPVDVSSDSGQSKNPSIAVDSRGTVHLVWNDDTPGNEEIYYAYKPENGNWSTPVNISNNYGASRSPCIQVDKNDKIHIVWQDDSPSGVLWKIFHIYKSTDSLWSVPETITAMGVSLIPVLAVDNNLGLHLFWMEGISSDDCRYHYAYKPNGGQWNIQYLFTTSISSYEMKVDNIDGVHIVLDPYAETYYIEKTPNGVWSDTTRISHSPTDWQLSVSPSIAIDNDLSVHVAWAENDTALYGVAYVKKTSQGGWGQIEAPYKKKIGFSRPKICIDMNHNIHIIWGLSDIGYGVKYSGQWQNPRTLVKDANCDLGEMAVTINSEKIYYTWTYTTMIPNTPVSYEIYYIEFKIQ